MFTFLFLGVFTPDGGLELRVDCGKFIPYVVRF